MSRVDAIVAASVADPNATLGELEARIDAREAHIGALHADERGPVLPAVGATAYVAVRFISAGRYEWLDIGTTACLREQAAAKAAAIDAEIPSWAAENPVVRIVEVRVTETGRAR